MEANESLDKTEEPAEETEAPSSKKRLRCMRCKRRYRSMALLIDHKCKKPGDGIIAEYISGKEFK